MSINISGPSKVHTFDFKKVRSSRIDSYVAETNKLVIRLEKLMKDMPTDPVKRKGTVLTLIIKISIKSQINYIFKYFQV